MYTKPKFLSNVNDALGIKLTMKVRLKQSAENVEVRMSIKKNFKTTLNDD